MSDVRVSIHLPYLLLLPSGDYPTPSVGGGVRLREATIPGNADGPGESRTEASAVFVPPTSLTEDESKQLRVTEANRLLRRVNYLLRWYRAVSRQAQVTELSRAQSSPFRFTIDETGDAWSEPLEYEAARVPPPANLADMHQAVRDGLASNTDPAVATLSLLDAEYAVKTGRFREAVCSAGARLTRPSDEHTNRWWTPPLPESGPRHASSSGAMRISRCASG